MKCLLLFLFTLILTAPVPQARAADASPTSSSSSTTTTPKKKKRKPFRFSERRSAPSTNLPPAEAAKVVEKINDGNTAMKKFSEDNERCALCELKNQTETTGGTETRADELIKMRKQFEATGGQEGLLQEPKTNANTSGSRSALCGDRPGGFQACIFHGDVSPGQFRFVDKTGAHSREWQFDFANRARQDLGFSISDVNDNSLSKSKETYMMVFPRRYVPSIRVEGGRQVVTLPTGEQVIYDANSKRILSGALNNDKQYTGTGVVIRADRTGEDPRLGKGKATITKNGKSCQVPLKSLWPDQSENSALHFKFATDEEFDAFLKSSKCGFGVFN